MLEIVGYAFTNDGPMRFRDGLEVADVKEFQELVKTLTIEKYLVILKEV